FGHQADGREEGTGHVGRNEIGLGPVVEGGSRLPGRGARFDLQDAFAYADRVVGFRRKQVGVLEDAWEKPRDQRRRPEAIEVLVRLLVGKLVGRLIEFTPFDDDRTQTDLAIRRRTATWLAQNEEQTAARSKRIRDEVGR